MAEYFEFRPVIEKDPHWSTIPNDLFSLGVAGAMAAAAILAGVVSGYYAYDLGMPLEGEDGLGAVTQFDLDVF